MTDEQAKPKRLSRTLYGCFEGHYFWDPEMRDGGAAWPLGYCPWCGNRAFDREAS